MEWLEGREPSTVLRSLESDVRAGDSPIAKWAREHDREQARARSWGMRAFNAKRKPL
jgi:hypothetical protein